MQIFQERLHVMEFQRKFDIPMSVQPALLCDELFDFRRKFLDEELREFIEAHHNQNLCDVADALVDLAYVLHGTALLMGLPWAQIWNEVHQKNMQKIRVLQLDESKRGSCYDVIKPIGWIPPDHTQFLGSGPWPIFTP